MINSGQVLEKGLVPKKGNFWLKRRRENGIKKNMQDLEILKKKGDNKIHKNYTNFRPKKYL